MLHWWAEVVLHVCTVCALRQLCGVCDPLLPLQLGGDTSWSLPAVHRVLMDQSLCLCYQHSLGLLLQCVIACRVSKSLYRACLHC